MRHALSGTQFRSIWITVIDIAHFAGRCEFIRTLIANKFAPAAERVNHMKISWRMVVLTGFSGLLCSCAQLGYLVQAAHGQSSLLSAARPIDDWLADPQAAPSLKS